MSMRIHPSILSADFVNFAAEFQTISQADAIHIDVMDGHFVPNLTFGLPMVEAMKRVATLPTDVHLMIANADVEAIKYADAGVDSVTFHLEASTSPAILARKIKSSGAKAAIAIKPKSNIRYVLDHLGEFDMVLVMTVEPGFGGQEFMEDQLWKVQQLREAVDSAGSETVLQVDGGIDEETIKLASSAGANVFVAGSSVFKHSDRNSVVNHLRVTASNSR